MTNRPWSNNADAMREWLSEPYSADLEGLDVTDLPDDIETDPRIAAERFREGFNCYVALERTNAIARQVHPDYPELIVRESRRARSAGVAHGFREAEADAPELAELRDSVMARHRAANADGDVMVIDPRRAEDGSRLPMWSSRDPHSGNVIRALIASHPDRVFVLRGGFGPQQLSQMVFDGAVESRCGVGVSPMCDPKCSTDRAGAHPVWGMFALTSGPHVIFVSICRACYWDFFHSQCSSISFDVFTPGIDDAGDWQQRNG